MKKLVFTFALFISVVANAETTKLRISDQVDNKVAQAASGSNETSTMNDGTQLTTAPGHQGYVPVIRTKERHIPCHACERF